AMLSRQQHPGSVNRVPGRVAILILDVVYFLFFFFQAEDGIRDKLVTGVQTCALPISLGLSSAVLSRNRPSRETAYCGLMPRTLEIGRASCRERVEVWGGGGGF